MPSAIGAVGSCFSCLLAVSGHFQRRELGELLINSGNRLLEHPAVGKRGRPVEVGDGACARELERRAALRDRALLGGQRWLSYLRARGLILLRLDRFRFPATRHDVYLIR